VEGRGGQMRWRVLKVVPVVPRDAYDWVGNFAAKKLASFPQSPLRSQLWSTPGQPALMRLKSLIVFHLGSCTLGGNSRTTGRRAAPTAAKARTTIQMSMTTTARHLNPNQKGVVDHTRIYFPHLNQTGSSSSRPRPRPHSNEQVNMWLLGVVRNWSSSMRELRLAQQ